MRTINRYELATTNGRKSFYRKAIIEQHEDFKSLISYETEVAKVYKNGNIEVYGIFSNTTLIHIRTFLESEGFGKLNKKQIEGMINK